MGNEAKSVKNVPPNRTKLLWIVLLGLGALIYTASYIFPPSLKIHNELLSISQCPKEVYQNLGYACGEYDQDGNPTFAMKMEDAKESDQFIHLDIVPTLNKRKPYQPENSKGESSHWVSLSAEISVFAVTSKNDILRKFSQEKKTLAFVCNEGEIDIHCLPQTLANASDIKPSHYIFVLKIFNTKELQDQQVEEIKLSLISLNRTFQDYMTYLKWVLFILSIVSYIAYRGPVSVLPKGFASVEQTVVGLMGLAVVLFNLPVINVFDHKKYNVSMFRVISIAIQNSLLILLWLFLIERLATTSKQKAPRKCRNIIKFIALIHFMVLSYVYGTLAHEQVNNILVNFNNTANPHLVQSSYYFMGFVAFISLWSLIRIFQILPNVRELDWRDSAAFTFTFCFVVCSLFFTWSHSFEVLNQKSTRIVLLYGITTLYTLLLQVIYAPLEGELEDAEKKRKYEHPETKAHYGDLDASEINPSDDTHLRSADSIKNKDIDMDQSQA